VLFINVQAFRIHVISNAAATMANSYPITFFMRQQNTGSALSFDVPTQPEGYVNFSIW
jgi:hypothetical protein